MISYEIYLPKMGFVIFISYDTESHFSYKYSLFQCVYVFFFTVHL